jgi:FkbM family methyltransferase
MGVDAFRVARVADHSFLDGRIEAQSVVVDLGVNEGAFALAMIEAYGCSVVGVEPVPALFAALPRHERLTVEQLAVTVDGGPATLYVNGSRCATIEPDLAECNAAAVEVPGTTLEALLNRHGVDRAPLVKVDIEGAEIAMLERSSAEVLARVDQFTIEFHDFLDPSLRDAVRAARDRLRSAGFAELSLSRDNTDVLFVNAARVPFGAAHRAAASVLYKYPRGLARQVNRRIGTLRRA